MDSCPDVKIENPPANSRNDEATTPVSAPKADSPERKKPGSTADTIREVGGRRDGTDPTRFGDWEKGGRCIDF